MRVTVSLKFDFYEELKKRHETVGRLRGKHWQELNPLPCFPDRAFLNQ